MLSSDNPSTRQRSLTAAREVVREAGLAALTTRAIARRSGLTQPAIYRHFAGVEDLTQETLGLIRDEFVQRLERTEQAQTPCKRLWAALEAFLDFAIEEPRLYDALFLGTGASGAAPPPTTGTRRGTIFGVLLDRVTDCAKSGNLRTTGPVATALSLAAHAQGLILLYRQGRFGSPERFAESYKRSMDDLLRGLSPADSESSHFHLEPAGTHSST